MLNLRLYLQNEYGLSRRKIISLIKDGKIFLNEQKIDNYNEMFKLGDVLRVEGHIQDKKILNIKQSDNKLLILNKPVGYIVSKSSDQGKSIYDILPDKYKNRYYIGRLDKDSCGLILLTNDSKLVNDYSHPSNKVEKEYEVIVNQKLSDLDINKTLTGISDKEEKLSFKNIKFIGLSNGKKNLFVYKVFLEEGKNRHIRRVFEYFGLRVVSLKRLREGKFSLGKILSGKYVEVDI